MSEKKEEFNDFSPDELRKLYQENPAHFDELAEEAIRNACKTSTPEKSLKLQQMQWSIDMQLRKGKTQLGRMHIMEDIFYRRVYGANGELEKLVASCNSLVRTIGGGTDRRQPRKEQTPRLRKV